MTFWENISQAERELIEFLYTSKCLRLGDFKLKSGRQSPYFIEMQESFNSVDLKIVGNAYAEKISELPVGTFNLILAPAEKGTALGIATALCLPKHYGRIPVFWDRKQPKDYGTHKRPSWIVGPHNQLENMVRKQTQLKALIIDDVITTGATKKVVMNLFEQEVAVIAKEQEVNTPKTEWIRMYIAVNRRERDELGRNPLEIFQSELGLPISWVTDSYNIYGYLGSRKMISKEEIAQFINYQAKYGLPEDRTKLQELSELIK